VHVRRGYDWQAEFISPKSPAALRTIKIYPAVRQSLLAWRLASEHTKKSDRMFPVSPGSHRKPMRQIYDKLRENDPEFPTPTLHGFRHGFASIMAGRGIRPKTLQKWMGHEKIELTMNIYVKTMEDAEERQIAENLGGFAGLEPSGKVVTN
jgi:integrase